VQLNFGTIFLMAQDIRVCVTGRLNLCRLTPRFFRRKSLLRYPDGNDRRESRNSQFSMASQIFKVQLDHYRRKPFNFGLFSEVSQKVGD
jgi:hypothetical protein